MQDKGGQALILNLGSNRTLTSVRLGSCKLHDAALSDVLPGVLSRNTCLRTLDMSRNLFSKVAMSVLCAGKCRLQYLYILLGTAVACSIMGVVTAGDMQSRGPSGDACMMHA